MKKKDQPDQKPEKDTQVETDETTIENSYPVYGSPEYEEKLILGTSRELGGE